MRYLVVAALVVIATACGPSDTKVNAPAAVPLSDDALGHFCQMHLADHEGPKAQVHLAGYDAPLWFSQIRDGIAFIKAGERPSDALAFYVNDMSRADSWAKPGRDNWIDANDAIYVVGSDALGGMGAPEVVPFSRLSDAEIFASDRGGHVLSLRQIPAAAVLSPVDMADGHGGNRHDH